jgi:hypothetical protein
VPGRIKRDDFLAARLAAREDRSKRIGHRHQGQAKSSKAAKKS